MMWVVRGLVIPIFALVLLVLCWRNGEVRVHTKLILTLLYLASWGLLLLGDEGIALLVAQLGLLIVTGVITYGREFLRGRS